MFPKVTTPLAKALRTSEGVLVYLLNAALAALALVDPSKLPAKEAAILATVITGAHLISRTLLKVVAVQKDLGFGEPEHVDVVDEVKGLLEHHAGVHQQQLQELTKAISSGLNDLNSGLADHIRQIVSEIQGAANKPLVAQSLGGTPPGPPSPPDTAADRPVA